MVSDSLSISRIRTLIVTHYVALLAATLSLIAPVASTTILGTAVFLCFILLAYFLRIDEHPNSFTWAHLSYIIRSFWVSVVILLFSLVFSLTFLLFAFQAGYLDATPLNACMAAGELSPCMRSFIDANKYGFRIASVIVMAPIILYFLLRTFRGLTYALRGRIPE